MDPALSRLLRQLPAVDELLRHPRLAAVLAVLPRPLAVAVVRDRLHAHRQRFSAAPAGTLPGEFDLEGFLGEMTQALEAAALPSLRRVINATGVIIHTNLGRSLLAGLALEQILEVASHYSNLEYDLARGERGSRHDHLEGLLKELTGCEAALVVNNNAAAVMLALNTLAQGREVIVSRGQLVEIGGSFRIPDVMAQSGAILKEVGTTNKTHLGDYERAVTDDTALLLKVHTSNYKIIGFTSGVSVQELLALGRGRKIPVFEDLGSGVLVDFVKYGLTQEPTVSDSIRAGVDVLTCSGDKLFGGPQAGIIAGTNDIINRIKKNPLTRALRVDKFTLAAMEATLRLYLDEEAAVKEIPTLNMITLSLEELRLRAEKLCAGLRGTVASGRFETEVVEGFSQVGGGALPEENIPAYLVSVEPHGMTVNSLEEKLRYMEPPVLARIQKDRLLFDPRTLLDGDEAFILRHIEKIMGKG